MIEKPARRQLLTVPGKRMRGGKIEHKMKGEIRCPRCLPALWHELQAVYKESMEKRQSMPGNRQFVVKRHARDRWTVPAAKGMRIDRRATHVGALQHGEVVDLLQVFFCPGTKRGSVFAGKQRLQMLPGQRHMEQPERDAAVVFTPHQQ